MGFDLFVAGIGNNLFMQLKFWMRIGFFFFFQKCLEIKKISVCTIGCISCEILGLEIGNQVELSSCHNLHMQMNVYFRLFFFSGVIGSTF